MSTDLNWMQQLIIARCKLLSTFLILEWLFKVIFITKVTNVVAINGSHF